jgi:hypothetical protein
MTVLTEVIIDWAGCRNRNFAMTAKHGSFAASFNS